MQNEQPGWHNAGSSSAYYITRDGKKATGYQMLGGAPYFFGEDGTPAPKGWIDLDKSKDQAAYCVGEGKLAVGWKYIEGKVRYFYQREDEGKNVFPGAIKKRVFAVTNSIVKELEVAILQSFLTFLRSMTRLRNVRFPKET